MNKRIKLSVLACFAAGSLMAQQKPYYTQYILNNYILNPALSGIESYTDIKLSYRKQWTGIEGAPVTTYFSMQGPIGENKDDRRSTPTSFEPAGTNVRGDAYFEEFAQPQAHKGAGLIIMNDKTGYINRFSVYGSFAYHKPMSGKSTLALGFMGGISNVSLDRSKIVWGTLDPNDPAIGYNNGELKKLMPEIGAGLWYYSQNAFIGASVLNIIPGKAKFVKSSDYGTYYVPHYFASAGYRFLLNNSMSVLPSVLVQKINPEPLQLHVNVKVQYEDRLWFGGSYRFSDQLGGFAAMTGVNVSHMFNIGYSYDASTTSRLRTYTRNTHEIILGFLLNNNYGGLCPRNVW